MRAIFLDPRVREMYQDWEPVTERAVSELRALSGPYVEDSRLNELVGELSVRSDRFRELWARHDARPKRSGVARVVHPLVGPLELSFEKLAIPDTDDQTLAVCHAQPDSPSAHALALLASGAPRRRSAASKVALPERLVQPGDAAASL